MPCKCIFFCNQFLYNKHISAGCTSFKTIFFSLKYFLIQIIGYLSVFIRYKDHLIYISRFSFISCFTINTSLPDVHNSIPFYGSVHYFLKQIIGGLSVFIRHRYHLILISRLFFNQLLCNKHVSAGCTSCKTILFQCKLFLETNYWLFITLRSTQKLWTSSNVNSACSRAGCIVAFRRGGRSSSRTCERCSLSGGSTCLITAKYKVY